MALNVELRTNDGSEHWNWECSFKHQNENATLNVKRKRDMMALNVELRTNDGSECWNWEYDPERQNENVTLNVKRKKEMMALNVELKMQGDNEGEICPSVACCYNSQSMGRVWERLHESQKMLHWRVGTVKSTINMASQSIELNHKTWWCVSTSQTPLT